MSGGGKGLSAAGPNEQGRHDPLETFAVASHATALTTFALNRALRNQGDGCQVRACVVSPGRVRTGFLGLGGRIFGTSPRVAADSVVWAATSPQALECMQKGVDEPFFSPGMVSSNQPSSSSLLQIILSIVLTCWVVLSRVSCRSPVTHPVGSLSPVQGLLCESNRS